MKICRNTSCRAELRPRTPEELRVQKVLREHCDRICWTEHRENESNLAAKAAARRVVPLGVPPSLSTRWLNLAGRL